MDRACIDGAIHLRPMPNKKKKKLANGVELEYKFNVLIV